MFHDFANAQLHLTTYFIFLEFNFLHMVLACVWAILSVHLAEVAYYKLISVFLVSSFDICSMPSVFQVSAFLSHIFSEIADYNFTANMETEVLNILHPIAHVVHFLLYLFVTMV
jgi:hypothetical protein